MPEREQARPVKLGPSAPFCASGQEKVVRRLARSNPLVIGESVITGNLVKKMCLSLMYGTV